MESPNANEEYPVVSWMKRDRDGGIVSKQHQTMKIVIEDADVDVEIVPLVRWINSFDSASTLFSCQGQTQEQLDEFFQGKADVFGTTGYRPYVLFTCYEPLDLITILRRIRYCAICLVDYELDNLPLRYCLQFESLDKLIEFSSSLVKHM